MRTRSSAMTRFGTIASRIVRRIRGYAENQSFQVCAFSSNRATSSQPVWFALRANRVTFFQPVGRVAPRPPDSLPRSAVSSLSGRSVIVPYQDRHLGMKSSAHRRYSAVRCAKTSCQIAFGKAESRSIIVSSQRSQNALSPLIARLSLENRDKIYQNRASIIVHYSQFSIHYSHLSDFLCQSLKTPLRSNATL